MTSALDDLPLFTEDVSWEEAQTQLEARVLGDGLPLVPPTRKRLDAMLAGYGATDRSFGHVMPLMGDLTLAAVAYNCILAGCYPSELPIVLTAVEAAIEEPFNLLGVLSTTGTPTVAICVHGPAVDTLKMNAGGNTLGPGSRANACIGRAVSLVLRNVGGARAGIGDMATMGQPGKYTFCFAEGRHSGVPSLATRRGFTSNDSCVTVLGVSGTAEILPDRPGDTPECVLQPVATAMIAALNVSGNKSDPTIGEQVFLLPPEMANILENKRWDLEQVQRYLFENSHLSERQPAASAPADIHPIVTGGAGIKMTYVPLWSGGTRTITKKIRELGN